MMRTPDTDLGEYAVSGAFALAVYLVAIAVLFLRRGFSSSAGPRQR